MGAHQTIQLQTSRSTPTPNSTDTSNPWARPHPLTHPSRVVVTGFAAGTLIETPFGPQPIETLNAGDLVCTRTAGVQTLGQVGQRHFAAPGEMGAVIVAPGAIGNRDSLSVSPGSRIELPRGTVAAMELVNDDFVLQAYDRSITYYYIQFDEGQTIDVQGATFHIGAPSVLCILDRDTNRPDRMTLV